MSPVGISLEAPPLACKNFQIIKFLLEIHKYQLQKIIAENVSYLVVCAAVEASIWTIHLGYGEVDERKKMHSQIFV